MNRRQLLGSAVLVSAVVALAGCAAAGGGASAPAATGTATPKSTAPDGTSASPTAGPVFAVMPATCDDLATPEQIETALGSAWAPADATPLIDVIPGPIARAAATGADERRECVWWPVPAAEAYLDMRAYRLSEPARDELIDSLRDSPEYTAIEVAAHEGFTHTELGDFVRSSLVYVFADDIWFVVAGGGEPGELLRLAEVAVDNSGS